MSLYNAKWVKKDSTEWAIGLSAYIKSQNDTSAVVCVEWYFAISSTSSASGEYSDWNGQLTGSGLPGSSTLLTLKNAEGIGASGLTWVYPEDTDGLMPFDYCGYKTLYQKEINVTKKSTATVCSFSAALDMTGDYPGLSISNSVTVPAITIYKPYAPSKLDLMTASSTSDNNVLTITQSYDTTHPVDAIRIERKVNSGAWVLLGTVKPGTSGAYVNYIDAAPPTVNAAYVYRSCASNSKGLSAYVESSTVYTPPAAPIIGETRRLSDTDVGIEVFNDAYMASALQVQRMAEGGTWEDLRTIDGKVTYFEDSPGTTLYRYRARNLLTGTAASDWSDLSDWIVASHAPNAPTLVAPSQGEVVDVLLPLTFRWNHNTVDGSSQMEAEVAYSLDSGETWTTKSGGVDSFLLLDPCPFENNTTVQWRARTKGSHSEWSPWSGVQSFQVRKPPSVVVLSPNGVELVEVAPVHVELECVDESGEIVEIIVSVRDARGAEVCSYNAGSNTVFDIPLSIFFPENLSSYSMAVSVRSTSSFVTNAVRDFNVEFLEPMLGDLEISKDPLTGYVSIEVGVIQDEERADASEFSVWRIVEDSRVLLADRLKEGDIIADQYAPLNIEFKYEVTSFAESGVYANNSFNEYFLSSRAFFYWLGKITYIDYNPKGDITLDRPSKQLVYYAGRRYPVSYDGENLSSFENVSGRIFERNNALMLKELMNDGGRCIYKSLDGEVYHADASVSLTPNYVIPSIWGEASIDLTRIDGRAL